MIYKVKLEPLAEKQAATLDKHLHPRLAKLLKELSLNPTDPRISKPIKMSATRRAARLGDYRVLYWIAENDKAVIVVAICPRRKAYDRLMG